MEETKCYCGHTIYCDCGPEEMNQELNTSKLNMTEQTIKFRDPVVQCVVNKFVDRSDVGFAKYGKTMRDDKSDIFIWLNHLQEELMDATLYLQRLKEEISTLREEKALLKEINDIDVVDAFEYLSDKKKQWKDSKDIKVPRNGHGRNFEIDEEVYLEFPNLDHEDWKDILYKRMPVNSPFYSISEFFRPTCTTTLPDAKDK